MAKSSGFLAVCAIAALAIGHASSARAGDLVYTPVNPSFGGNPLNSSHLLNVAGAQRTATARDATTSSSSSTTGSSTSSDADLFIRQLQSRLLTALSAQVADAIFGENPQDSGTVQFGETVVSFERTLDSITLTITEPSGVTVIVVPQLVTTSGLSSAALPAAAMTVPETLSVGNGSLNPGLFEGSLTTGGELGGRLE